MSKWFSSTYNVNFTAPAETLSYSTPFPNSLFHPSPLLLSALISSPSAKLLPLPVIFFSYSSLKWKQRDNVNFADSCSGSLTSITNSSASPKMSAHWPVNERSCLIYKRRSQGHFSPSTGRRGYFLAFQPLWVKRGRVVPRILHASISVASLMSSDDVNRFLALASRGGCLGGNT